MASKAKVGLPSISSVQIVGAKIMVPMISSPSASWRGSDSIRVLLFSLTLRSGRAILRYNPRLLSSWPTSSTDAPRLRSIAEAVESSFPLHLQSQLDQAAEVFRQPAGARNGCLSEGHDGVQLDQIG